MQCSMDIITPAPLFAQWHLQGTRRFRRWCLLYHKNRFLSRTFFKVFWRFFLSSRVKQFFKFTTLRKLCQELFFRSFWTFAFRSSAATCLGYHILWPLSSVFFTPPAGAVLTAPTALLEYQTFHHLSTPFSCFFNIYYFSVLFLLIS